ncbi:MAG: right-handed parallel beta-helix repeat-containing protein [Planctomycetes bacterium]|nr:right-handed parallel beta-helix repeat-containing protein [Planctomycetota bacterium]
MGIPSRRPYRGAVRLAGALLVVGLLLLPAGLTDSASTASRAGRSGRGIVVNTAAAQPTADQINLARALAMAAEDPADNVIRFDPAVFRVPITISLTEPIAPPEGGGKDRIEGPSGGAAVTLDASACPDAGVLVGDGASLTLVNLIIQGGKDRAVLLKDKGSLSLHDVTIRSAGGPGIALFGEARADLARCRLVANQTHGLEVHGECAVVLRDVEISGGGQSGIAGFDRSSVTAANSRLDRNGHWNVVLTGQARADLDGCTLSGAEFANVDVSESARLALRNSTLEQGRRFGLFATGQSSVDMAGGGIRRHASRGIEMQDSARLVMQAAEVDGSGDYGVILFEQCSIRAVACKFTRNAGHGVSLRGRATGDFKGCLFSRNRYSGLGCLDARDGGAVAATQCIFQGNGMRPIYRGPLHLDPLVPTPLSIDDETVACLADPRATVELYLDRAGEAARYLKTLQADEQGRFRVDRAAVPDGWVMTASATASGSTSEFNVVAGASSADAMGALLAHTGPLSDIGGDADLDGGLRRWRTGTKLILHVANPPSVAVERYARFVTEHVVDWTRGAVRAELCVGAAVPSSRDAVVVPVRYLSPDAEALLGRGGVTFMKWDGQGYFMSPMRILLATGADPRETCPRVLAHEFGHVLGLCHARVGLLSRMQGSTPPTDAFVNDFSPMFTFYDVQALHVLSNPRWGGPATLRQLVAAGALPPAPTGTTVASLQPTAVRPTYSPPPAQAQPAGPQPAHRP